jgi:hypothetical protein
MAGKKRKAYSTSFARASEKRQKRSAALVKVECVFQGIAPVSERGEAVPRAGSPPSGPRWPFGTPSAGLTLGGLLASRARLRFTRRTEITCNKPAVQGQGTGERFAGSRPRMEIEQATGRMEARPSFALVDAMDRLLCCPLGRARYSPNYLNYLSTFPGELQQTIWSCCIRISRSSNAARRSSRNG